MITMPLMLAAALTGAVSGTPAGSLRSTAVAPRAATTLLFATEAPALAHSARDPQDSLYATARNALSSGKYAQAATLFDSLTRTYPKSQYAGDALYWRAYALYRLGGAENLNRALAALESQKASYSGAGTRGDADALAVRVRGELARMGNADAAQSIATTASQSTAGCATAKNGDDEGDDDNDIRVAALNALLQMDAERAMPILKKVLEKRDACSVPLRRKAVFLVAQKHADGGDDLLLNVVKNDPSPQVREQAVFWLGQVQTEKASAALEQIATTSPDTALREKAIFALMQQGSDRGQALVRKLAESNDTPMRIREQAIFWIGQRPSAENAQALRNMFARLNGQGDRAEEVQKRILFSLSQMKGQGNDEWLLGVALDTTRSTEIRKQALFTAGQAGIPASQLVKLYDRIPDRGMKEQLVWVLSQSDASVATDKLFEIAKHDKDVELRKKALFWLGQKNDPRVQQLLLDIINQD